MKIGATLLAPLFRGSLAVAAAAALAVTLTAGQLGQGPPAAGDPDATLEVQLFTSFACEPCSRASIVVEGLLAARPRGVRVVFRHLPPDGDAVALVAHRAAVAAAGQGRFWPMQALMFGNLDRLSAADLAAMASALGMDVARFAADLENTALDAVIEADAREAKRLSIVSAPAFVFPSGRIAGFLTRQQLIDAVDAER